MDTKTILALARKNAGPTPAGSSARLCLADAVKLYDAEKMEDARKRALDSIRYSVGVFHRDYKRASK